LRGHDPRLRNRQHSMQAAASMTRDGFMEIPRIFFS
jgi:hypothetical protein